MAAPGDALILGSGLTGLDLLLTLQNRKQAGVLHVLSRHGLFPQPHRAGLAPWPAFLRAGELPTTVRAMLRIVREQIAQAEAQGSDWRAVIDALRPFTQEFWQGLNPVERSRFLRHLRARWEPHRHRAAPEVLAIKEELERSGQLVCHRGRIERIAEVDGGSALEVIFQRHGKRGERETLRVSYVVNCTGPECNYHRLGDRPESWTPRMNTLVKVGQVSVNRPGDWSDRMRRIRPTLLRGFAHLLELQRTERKSLAAFKPSRVLDFPVEEETGEWTEAQRAALDQLDFYDQSRETLEKMRYAFRIRFEDENGAKHSLKIIDWEFAQLWRKERDRLGSAEAAVEQVRKKLAWIAQGDKEVILFTGNLANPAMRRSFIVLGFCYPKLMPQMSLF